MKKRSRARWTQVTLKSVEEIEDIQVDWEGISETGMFGVISKKIYISKKGYIQLLTKKLDLRTRSN